MVWLKRLAIAFSVMIVLSVVGVLVFLMVLPNPKEIMGSSQTPGHHKVNSASESKKELSAPVVSPTVSELDTKSAIVEPMPTPAPDAKQQALQRIKDLSEEPLQSRADVCRDIQEQDRVLEDTWEKSFANSVSKILQTEPEPVGIEKAWQIPVIAALKVSSVNKFLNEVSNMKDRPSEMDFVNKAGFYATMTQAAAELMLQKQVFEEMAQRAQYLYVLAKVLERKPELRRDSRVMTYCEELQDGLLDPQPEGMYAAREDLISLLGMANMSPNDLGVNLDKPLRLNIKVEKNQFSMGFNSH